MTAQTAYRTLIDGLVEVSRLNVAGDSIRAHGHAERINTRDLALSPEEQARKALLLSLDRNAREIIVQMLAAEREAAVHDVLAHLDRLVADEQIAFGAQGVSFADVADGSFHFDCISRCVDEPWPSDD